MTPIDRRGDRDGRAVWNVGDSLLRGVDCLVHALSLSLLLFQSKSLDHGFIPYPYMDTDPSFAAYRSDPTFLETRALAIERQKKFLAYRTAHP